MTKNSACVLIQIYFIFVLLLGVFGSEFVQIQHLSTWTTEYPLQSPDAYSPVPQGCSVKTGVLIARHGNRFPTKPTLESLDALSKKLKDMNPFPQYSWLKDWQNPVPETEAGLLVDRGQRIHYELAKRFQQNFPSLSNYSYSPELFPIRSTYVSRTALSAASFAYGLFEGRGVLPKNYNPVYIQTGPEKKDLLLRFFDSCPKYQQKVMRSGAAQLEAKKWGEMVFPSVLREIEALVGVSNLTLDDALAMWFACELEVGVYNKHQGFCSLFDEARTQKMEYFEDLFHYWANFYGFDINWQMAAPLLQEVATALNSSVDDFSTPLRMYFAHAETIMPFVALLGLFQDSEKLLANSPRDVVMNRKFRASLVSPFAANVVFVGYQCGSQDFKIKVMVNEKEMTLPGCSALYCPLEEFLALYKQKLNFDFHDLCDQTSNSSVGKGKQNLHMTFT